MLEGLLSKDTANHSTEMNTQPMHASCPVPAADAAAGTQALLVLLLPALMLPPVSDSAAAADARKAAVLLRLTSVTAYITLYSLVRLTISTPRLKSRSGTGISLLYSPNSFRPYTWLANALITARRTASSFWPTLVTVWKLDLAWMGARAVAGHSTSRFTPVSAGWPDQKPGTEEPKEDRGVRVTCSGGGGGGKGRDVRSSGEVSAHRHGICSNHTVVQCRAEG